MDLNLGRCSREAGVSKADCVNSTWSPRVGSSSSEGLHRAGELQAQATGDSGRWAGEPCSLVHPVLLGTCLVLEHCPGNLGSIKNKEEGPFGAYIPAQG